ncbi:MAG: peptide deformylase [Patescibacteria group bacterium]
MKIVTIENDDKAEILKTRIPDVDIHAMNKSVIRELARDMRKIMRAADGVGLAANQIGLNIRMFVAEVPGERGGRPKFYALLNPEIIKVSKEKQVVEEGCLSVPGIFGPTPRAEKITFVGYDANGKKVKIKAWGFLARVLQHETDHLNGHLFTEKAKSLHPVEIKKV